MRSASQITFTGMRAVMSWSPTGVVLYRTAEGWMARKDQAVVVSENRNVPRVWKKLDTAVDQLSGLGVKNFTLETA